MKQKFTLHIADFQLSVVTDATEEQVEHIRGILDRKMREIYLRSRCPKTEAALLCALDCVGDRLTIQEHAEELEARCEKYELVLEGLKERNEEKDEEIERLHRENEVLRSLLTRTGNGTEGIISPDPISPTEFFASVADAQNEPEPAPKSEPAPVAEAPKSRSRVGSMFDLLSFGEAD